MYLPRLYEPGEFRSRLRYAITNIIRDRVVDEGAFRICFEMEDGEEIVLTILRRGLKSQKLRSALERSHLINIQEWLVRYPELASKYYEDP